MSKISAGGRIPWSREELELIVAGPQLDGDQQIYLQITLSGSCGVADGARGKVVQNI